MHTVPKASGGAQVVTVNVDAIEAVDRYWTPAFQSAGHFWCESPAVVH